MKFTQIIKDSLKISLLGKLRSYSKEYSQKSSYIFDSQNIFCYLTKWTSPGISYSISANTFCNDPNVGGMNMSNYLSFWSKSKFGDKNDATNFLEKEIIIASKKFTDTKFYITHEDECIKYCLDGKWIKCAGIPNLRYCEACRQLLNETDSTFCSSCGEPIFFN